MIYISMYNLVANYPLRRDLLRQLPWREKNKQKKPSYYVELEIVPAITVNNGHTSPPPCVHLAAGSLLSAMWDMTRLLCLFSPQKVERARVPHERKKKKEPHCLFRTKDVSYYGKKGHFLCGKKQLVHTTQAHTESSLVEANIVRNKVPEYCTSGPFN